MTAAIPVITRQIVSVSDYACFPADNGSDRHNPASLLFPTFPAAASLQLSDPAEPAFTIALL